MVSPSADSDRESTVGRFAAWAETQEDIRAAMVVGSRAAQHAAPDHEADLNILVVTDGAREFCQDESWLSEIGEYVLSFFDTSPTGPPERRVLFSSGLDATFTAVSTETVRRAIASGQLTELGALLRRGMRVILDRDELIPQLVARTADSPSDPPPTETDFLSVVHSFWYYAVRTARLLRRGELWQAKESCDRHMKDAVHAVLQWHARDRRLPGGSFEQWADVRALRELGDAFARYDEDEVWRALFATMSLFSWLAPETARQFGFSYPATGEASAVELVRQLNAGRSR